eukprot:TRINITY_DN3568_c0_g1_i12.p1 TRINITY_DN3568_c0_g1~~TRINITY_DN3568_c0_g1_i12.p1  ORF type:complete len:195 (+),score=27.89 TRINITY_DN3568_c0_g1_i12:434-1018(+)
MMENQAAFDKAKSKHIKGLYQFENFVTPAEACLLISQLEGYRQPWGPSGNGQHTSVSWGVISDYEQKRNRLPDPSAGGVVTPDFLQPIIERLCAPGKPWSCLTANWTPNEGNANLYIKDRGDFLRDHYDNRALSGPIIASVTLRGNCTLSFKDFGKGTTQDDVSAGTATVRSCIRVPLPALCLRRRGRVCVAAK